jgi:hypothetical protein
MGARVLKPRATQFPNRAKLFGAVRAEWVDRYRQLLGHPWDGPKVKALLEELWALRKTDREAMRAIAQLAKGISAIHAFCDKNPPIGKQDRRGLKFHMDFAPDHTDLKVLLDPDTMPANVVIEDAPSPLQQRTLRGMFIPTEMAVKLESVSDPRLVLSCTGRLDGMSPIGMAVHMLKPQTVVLGATLDRIFRKRKRAPVWEARMAVLVLWDRDYAPGELPENRTRLSPSELAGISILTGNKPKLGNKALTVSNAIDAEARHIVRACEQLEKLRALGVPIPRYVRTEIDSTSQPLAPNRESVAN